VQALARDALTDSGRKKYGSQQKQSRRYDETESESDYGDGIRNLFAPDSSTNGGFSESDNDRYDTRRSARRSAGHSGGSRVSGRDQYSVRDRMEKAKRSDRDRDAGKRRDERVKSDRLRLVVDIAQRVLASSPSSGRRSGGQRSKY
jgi:hypothetical protein